MNTSCPLCQSVRLQAYAQDKKRAYLQCSECKLVFADPASWPTQDSEKAEYDLHENALDDEGYNRFLSRIVEPLNARIPAQSRILDFGCGPAPALAKQLTSLGHRVDLFDVFYYPNPAVWQKRYPAIVLTEVIEHLHTPAGEIERLWHQLEAGGVLAIMTQRVISQERFFSWQYKNDPTHVCFYSAATFQWLSEELAASNLEFIGRDMVFITK